MQQTALRAAAAAERVAIKEAALIRCQREV